MIPAEMFASAITYQTALMKYEQGVVDKLLALMHSADLDMTTKLVNYSGKGMFTAKWLAEVTGFIKSHIATSTGKEYDYIKHELSQLADIVANKELKILEAGLQPAPLKGPPAANELSGNISVTNGVVHYNFAKPSVDQLVAIAETQPIQGELLKKWFNKIGSDKQEVINKAIRMGMVEGDTIEKMVQRIAGTKAGDYKDGVLTISRRHAEAVARTAVNNVSNQAAHLTYQANKDVIKGWQFLATLDNRTTITCASLNGTKWPIGSGPIPPRHVRCRSFQLPDMKTWKELGVDLEEMPAGERASKDGPVKSDITFSDWLKGQPAKVRHEILGTERMKLFDTGELDLKDFTNKRGQVYSLQTLKGKYPDALEGVYTPKTSGIVLKGQKDAPVYEDFKVPYGTDKLLKLDDIIKKTPVPDVSNLLGDEVSIAGIDPFPEGLPTTLTSVKKSMSLDVLKDTYSATHIKNITPKLDEFITAFDTGGIAAVKEVAGQYKSIYLGGLKKAFNLAGAPADFMAGIDEMLEYGKAVTKAEMATKKAAQLSQNITNTATAVMEGSKLPAPHIDQFQKVGAKLGSNPGGTYKNLLTGEQWYIKIPDSLDMAQNEVIASKLYKLAGADVTELHFIDMGNGKWAVGSRWVEGLDINPNLLKSGSLDGVYGHFATDAWLANWDVVGLDYDNLKVLNGVKAIRVDPGGALYYRAQGGLKADFKIGSFGKNVDEIATLLDPNINAQSASVFGGITQKEVLESVARVLRITEGDIRNVVNEAGMLWPQAKRDELINILLERQKDLQRQFPQLVKTKVTSAGRVTTAEVEAIYAGRSNGYAIRSDYNQIEDQQILFHIEKQSNGVDRAIGTLKVRESGLDVLDELVNSGVVPEAKKVYTIAQLTQGVVDQVYDDMMTAIKGINNPLKTNPYGVLRDIDIIRAKAALKSIEDAYGDLPSGPIRKELYKEMAPWKEMLEKAVQLGEGGTWVKGYVPDGNFKKFTAPFTMETPVVSPKGITFVKRDGVYTRSEIENGFIKRTSVEEAFTPDGVRNNFFEADIDGVKVRYWQRGADDVSWTMQGKVQLIVDDATEQGISKAITTLEKLGIKAGTPLAAQAEEMYLQKIAYSIKGDDYNKTLKRITAMADPEKKVAAWKKYLEGEFGQDITKLSTYNPNGTMELWEQGQRVFLRPDLQGPEWEKFSKEFVLLHHQWNHNNYPEAIDRILNSGGKLASNSDRVRRGIRWGNTSAGSDFRSGGSDMVFTRIRNAGFEGDGFQWKPTNHLRRLDSISYSGDKYGRTISENGSADYVRKTRAASDIQSYKSMAGYNNNETIFKHGLSIFDDLIELRVPADEYDATLAAFRKHGWNKWPDGRALTDVIKRANRN